MIDSTMRYLKLSTSKKQRVELWVPRTRGDGTGLANQ